MGSFFTDVLSFDHECAVYDASEAAQADDWIGAVFGRRRRQAHREWRSHGYAEEGL